MRTAKPPSSACVTASNAPLPPLLHCLSLAHNIARAIFPVRRSSSHNLVRRPGPRTATEICCKGSPAADSLSAGPAARPPSREPAAVWTLLPSSHAQALLSTTTSAATSTIESPAREGTVCVCVCDSRTATDRRPQSPSPDPGPHLSPPPVTACPNNPRRVPDRCISAIARQRPRSACNKTQHRPEPPSRHTTEPTRLHLESECWSVERPGTFSCCCSCNHNSRHWTADR